MVALASTDTTTMINTMKPNRFFTSTNYTNSNSHLGLIILLLAIVKSSTLESQNADFQYIPPPYTCSPSLSSCNTGTHQCLANPNHPQSTTDEACAPCQSSDQTYWPCDVDNLCYCWDMNSPKIPPAPSTRLYNGGEGLNISSTDPCDIITPEVFHHLAPEASAPYSYDGFCTAVQTYNTNHPTEAIFNMGSIEQQKLELAAFFGNALHESDEFKAGREYLMCADSVTIGGEVYCRPCDSGSFDWETMKCPDGASLASENRTFNSYCQSNLLPPNGCECDNVYERASSGPMAGYVKADQVFFGRGSIQLSWNYNYIRASIAITGAPETFCQRPDLVATNEEYAWGAGLFYWMENIKNDRTCHQSILLNDDFGATLDNINGGLECPADDAGWHATAIVKRLNRYCRSATAIGVEKLSSLSGCMDMNKRMAQCLEEGTCSDCKVWEGTLILEEEDAGDASSTSSVGGRGGGRAKAGKQAKVETDPEQDGVTSETAIPASSSSSSSLSGEGKQEEDIPTVQHHEADTSTSSSSEQDASSSSNVDTITGGETMSSSGDKPPTELEIGDYPTDESSSTVESAQEPISSGSSVSGSHNVRTRRPTPSPIRREQQDPPSADESQFGIIAIKPTFTSSDGEESRPAQNPPASSPSLASQFASTELHSKGNDDPDLEVDQETTSTAATLHDISILPIENSEEISSSDSLAHGGMTNWANTKLETTTSVVTTSSAPTKSPITVINIADVFHMDDNNEETALVLEENDGLILESAIIDDQENVAAGSEAEKEFGASHFGNNASADMGSISGRIWHEKNNNGFEDDDEPGVRGVVVDLYRCGDDEWIEGTRTSAGGEYIFNDLQVDEHYYVVVTASPGYEFTIKNAGSEDSNNSDVNPTTGRGDCIQPSSSSSSSSAAVVNAGIAKKAEPSDSVDSISSTEDSSGAPEVNYNCRGEPCAEGAGYCRSKHNFCGTSEEYCNDESQWTSECGTPSPTPQPSLTPTTAQHTFKYDPDVNCSGERCDEGDETWCRSQVGYCGSGPLYCSLDSIWVPACDDAKKNTGSIPAATQMSDTEPTTVPSLPPSEDPLGVRFGPFALPTLSQIVTPKARSGVRVETKKRDEGDASFGAEVETLDYTMNSSEQWYDSFSETSVSRNVGSRRTLERRLSVCLTIIITFVFFR